MPRLRAIGSWPAATSFTPSRRLPRQDGGGGGAVAGDVGGLAGDFLHHLGAHVFELVLQLDFFGDGDAVFGDGRRAEILVEHDVAALGSERDFHGVGENIDAFQDRVARIAIKFNYFSCHLFLLRILLKVLLLENAEDIVLAHDQMLFAIDIDFGAGIFSEQDPIVHLDVERGDLAVVTAFPFRPPRLCLPAAFLSRCRE